MPYAGQLLELPGGVGTLTSDNNAARTRFLDLIQAEGIVSNRGVWEREFGCTPYATGALGSGLATFSFPAVSHGAAAVFASYRLTGNFVYAGLNTTLVAVAGITNPVVGAYGDVPDVPSGAAIVIAVTTNSATGWTSVADSAGNVYTKIGSQTFNAGAARVELWVALNVAALNQGQLFTINNTGGGVSVASVHVVEGLQVLDQALTASVAVAATSLTQPSAFALLDQNEGLLVAYGDLDSATSVLAAPSSLAVAGHIAFGVGSNFYHSPLPFVQAAANALSDYWTTPIVQRLLALGSDGILYKSSGGAFAALSMATTMTDGAGSMIVVGGQETAGAARKAFCFDGGATKIQTLSGDNAATTNFGNDWNTVTNIPVDWATNPPRGGVIHKERLWCWSPNNAPHNIYASKLRDHENFKNAVGGSLEYVQEIGTGIGTRIAACVSFKGMLFAFKFPRGIFFLDDTDVDYQNWRWNLVSDAVGVADSPYAALGLDDDVLLVDPAAHIHFLSAITQQGVRTSDLTARLNLQQWTRDNVNLGRLDRMVSAWYPELKLALLGQSAPTSVKNNLRMYLDFSNAEQDEGAASIRISYSHRDTTRALTVRRDSTVDGVQRPLHGEDNGIIWKWTPDSKIKVGVPNAGQARYQYSPTNFGHLDPALANKRKIFDALTVTFNPVGAWNLAIDSIIDGDYQETLYFSMGGGTSVLGTFALGGRFGGGSITTARRRMTGYGYWLSLAGWVQGEGHDFSVATHLVNYRVGGEEQR